MAQALVCLMALVSAYTPSAGGSNCDFECEHTAGGYHPGPLYAACGPGWELGTALYVPGYGKVFCEDRFGAPPTPAAVDVWMPSQAAALAWGVQWRSVCVAPPGPPPPEYLRY